MLVKTSNRIKLKVQIYLEMNGWEKCETTAHKKGGVQTTRISRGQEIKEAHVI